MNPASRHRPSLYSGFNQLLSVAGTDGRTTSFGYDGNGNQVSKADAAGTTTYAYTLDNRLWSSPEECVSRLAVKLLG